MPLYVYTCPKGHVIDLFRPVANRHDAVNCEVCNDPATLEVQTSIFDPKMGVDPGFPTAWDRWAKTHERAAKGK